MASIDLALLRQQEPILEPVSAAVKHSPAKLVCNAEPSTVDACGRTETQNCIQSHGGHRTLEIVGLTDDDFESIYSARNNPAGALDMSIGDAVLQNMMTSCPDEFKAVVRSVSFAENAVADDQSSETAENAASCGAEQSNRFLITLPPCAENSTVVARSASGSRQSMLVNNWVQLPAPANVGSLSVSSRHVWFTDVGGQLFYSHLLGPGLHWFVVTTAPAHQVAVSPSGSLVWRLDGGSAFAALNVSNRQPWGTQWIEVARDVAHISVDDNVAW